MSDLTVSMIFRADTPEARAELKRLASEMEKVGVTGRTVGKKAADGAKEAEAALKRQAAAARQAGVATAQGSQIGAAGVANLTAQFNDIGVMLAAGQSPLQLAIQQGTQISQVFGNRGAGAAVRALGSALVSMVSPLNLITIGSIAAGAAAVQWLAGMGEDVPAVEDLVDSLTASTERFRKKMEQATATPSELRAAFGRFASEVRTDLQSIGLEELATLVEEAGALVQAQAAEIGIRRTQQGNFGPAQFNNPNAVQLSRLFDLSLFGAKRGPRQDLIGGVLDSFGAVARTESIDEMHDAVREVEAAWRDAALAVDGLNQEENDALSVLRDIRLALAEQIALRDRLKAEEERRSRGDTYRVNASTRMESAKALQDAQELLSTLRDEALVRQLISEYGEDSAEVEEARIALAREAFKATLDTVDVADSLKREIMASWDAARGFADVDMSGNISAAVAQAMELARALGVALNIAMSIGNLQSGKVYSGRGGDPRQFEEGGSQASYENRLDYVPVDQLIKQLTPRTASAGGGGGGGGGGGSAQPAQGSLAALRQEAGEALREMELAVAGVHEKVRAGLQSTAEGTDAIADAKRRAAEALAELIPQLQQANGASGPEAAAAVEMWRAKIAELVDQLPGIASDLKTQLKDGLSGAFEDFFADFAKGKADIEDLGNALEDLFARAAAQKLTTSLVNPLIDSLFSFLPFADGGVPGGDLSDHRNTIVSQPTLFDMGGRTKGLMGEAGPEAILPTRPAPGGGLGVLAAGPDGQQGVLPLVRQLGGALGVQVEPFGKGGIPDAARRALKQIGGGSAAASGAAMPAWRPVIMDRPTFVDPGRGAALPGASVPEGARGGAGQKVTVNIHNNAQGVDVTATERDDGEGLTVDVLIAQAEGKIAGNIAQGRGPITAALARNFGLNRTGR